MENSLKLKIQGHTDDELLKIWNLKSDYTPEAVQHVESELSRRGLRYDKESITENEESSKVIPQTQSKESWLTIGIMLCLPIFTIWFADTDISIKAGIQIVKAFLYLLAYVAFVYYMFKFPKERRFTHYSTIYFIIWVILMIIG